MSVLDARATDASSGNRLAISLVLARRKAPGSSHAEGGEHVKLYLFTKKKHTVWLAALRVAVVWQVDTYYSVQKEQPSGMPSLFGRGLFAEVWKAVACDGDMAGDPVAVKVVSRPPSSTAAGKEVPVHPKLNVFLQREARICSIVRHADICPVFDVFEGPTALTIVMKAYPITLEQYIATNGSLPEHEAAAVIAAVLRGLQYLHELDIVHRDINPSNILLSSENWPFRAVLCDFGLSNFVDRRSARVAASLAKSGFSAATSPPAYAIPSSGETAPQQRPLTGLGSSRSVASHAYDPSSFGDTAALDGFTFNSAVGAPDYVAPEIVQRERYGAPVDVWACGVLLHYVLSGRLPFESKSGGHDATRLMEAVNDTRETWYNDERWRGTSPGAVSLMRSMLTADPRKRISAESALSSLWLLQPPLPSITMSYPASGPASSSPPLPPAPPTTAAVSSADIDASFGESDSATPSGSRSGELGGELLLGDVTSSVVDGARIGSPVGRAAPQSLPSVSSHAPATSSVPSSMKQFSLENSGGASLENELSSAPLLDDFSTPQLETRPDTL